MQIITNRLMIRPFSDQDLKAIYEIFSDQTINQFLPWFCLNNLEEAKKFYEERLASKNGLNLALVLKETKEVIGYINVSYLEPFDLGYGLRLEYQKQGYLQEGLLAVLNYLKQKTKLKYLTATHDINNPRSGNLMRKIGMQYCYTYQELWQPKNFLVNFRMYQINLRAEKVPTYLGYWNKYEKHYREELEK